MDGGVSAWILCESQKSFANVPDIFPELEREAKQRRALFNDQLVVERDQREAR